MKIIVISSTEKNADSIALPFGTDSQVIAAWKWIVSHGRLDGVNYRPESEGENPNRAFIHQYVKDIIVGTPRGELPADVVRSLIGSVHQSEMPHQIVDLFDPLADSATGGLAFMDEGLPADR